MTTRPRPSIASAALDARFIRALPKCRKDPLILSSRGSKFVSTLTLRTRHQSHLPGWNISSFSNAVLRGSDIVFGAIRLRFITSFALPAAGKKLDVSMTATTIAIFHKNRRVASHARSHRKYGHTTLAEHMPKAHQRHLQWTPSRIIHWAGKAGPCTQRVVTEDYGGQQFTDNGRRTLTGPS